MVATCTTELDIFNMALLAQGARRTISTTDKTNATEEMQAAFRPTRDALIRAYNWNCCIKEDTLGLLEKWRVLSVLMFTQYRRIVCKLSA